MTFELGDSAVATAIYLWEWRKLGPDTYSSSAIFGATLASPASLPPNKGMSAARCAAQVTTSYEPRRLLGSITSILPCDSICTGNSAGSERSHSRVALVSRTPEKRMFLTASSDIDTGRSE